MKTRFSSSKCLKGETRGSFLIDFNSEQRVMVTVTEGLLRTPWSDDGAGCGLRMLLSTHLCSLLQESWERLLASSKYNEQESFAVVFQPFFYETLSVSEGGHESLAHTRSPSRPVGLHRAQDCSLGEGGCCYSVRLFSRFSHGLGELHEAEWPRGKEHGYEPDGSWL